MYNGMKLTSEISAIQPTHLFCLSTTGEARGGFQSPGRCGAFPQGASRLAWVGTSHMNQDNTLQKRQKKEDWQWKEKLILAEVETGLRLFDKSFQMFPPSMYTRTYTHVNQLLLFFHWNLKTLSIISPSGFILSLQRGLVTQFYSIACVPVLLRRGCICKYIYILVAALNNEENCSL